MQKSYKIFCRLHQHGIFNNGIFNNNLDAILKEYNIEEVLYKIKAYKMNRLFKLTLLVSAILLMQGCATHGNFVKRYDSWVGQNISHLMQEIGYPDNTYVLPNKNKVYVYERSRVYSLHSTPMMGYGYGGYYGGYGMYGYGNDVMQETCKLFIETNKKGTIVKWGSRGNHCVSN